MIYCFIGPPASGKGTQARVLAEKLNIPYISTGEIFREASKEDQELAQILQKGELVSDEKVFEMYEQLHHDHPETFVFDGGVRTAEQVEKVLDIWQKKEIIPIFIEVPDEVIRDRAFKRLTVEKQGRSDDTEESVSRRIEIYHATIQAILDRFVKAGIAVVTINGDQTREAITQQLLEKLNLS